MSEISELPVSEADYEEAKAEVVAGMVRMLELADRLGKEQMQVAGEFMAAFQAACQETFG